MYIYFTINQKLENFNKRFVCLIQIHISSNFEKSLNIKYSKI